MPKDQDPNSSTEEGNKPEVPQEPVPSFLKTIDAPDGSGRKLTFYDLEGSEGSYFMKGVREAEAKRKARKPEKP